MELGKFVDKYHLEEDNMPDQDKVFLMKDDFIIEDLNWEYTRDEPTTEADE